MNWFAFIPTHSEVVRVYKTQRYRVMVSLLSELNHMGDCVSDRYALQFHIGFMDRLIEEDVTPFVEITDLPHWHREDSHLIAKHIMSMFGRDTFRALARGTRRHAAYMVSDVLTGKGDHYDAIDYC